MATRDPSRAAADLIAGIGTDALRAELARRGLGEFARWAWPLITGRPYVANRVTTSIVEALQRVGDGEVDRLIINKPPGCGASTLLVCYQAWRIARDPAWRTMAASHSYELAATASRRVRRLIGSPEFQQRYPVQLREDAAQIALWETTAGGHYIAVGRDSNVTGRRVNEIVVDDLAAAADKYSKAALEHAWTFFNETLTTRVDNDRSAMIVTGQRVAVDDVPGRLIAASGWTIVSVPAEDEHGEPTAPNVLPRARLDAIRTQIGNAAYQSQYLQNPLAAESTGIKVSHWRFFHEANAPAAQPRPRDAWSGSAVELPAQLGAVVIACDLGFKGGKENDNTAMVVVGCHRADRFVLDLVARPMEFTEQIATLLALRQRWPAARRIFVEDSANAAALKSELGRKVTGLIFIPARDSKLSRIMACSPAIESGNVFVRDGASWVDDLLHEAAFVPHGRRDDRIDALALALNQVAPTAEPTAEERHLGVCLSNWYLGGRPVGPATLRRIAELRIARGAPIDELMRRALEGKP